MKNNEACDECFCDVASNEYAFIKRTNELLKQYDLLVAAEKIKYPHIKFYSRTLFINCCLGLLLIPREKIYKDKYLNNRASEWGINTSDFRREKGKYEDILMKDLLRHIRNSLSHGKFICNYNSRKVLTSLHFEDYVDGKGRLSFSGTMSYKDFEAFVKLLAGYTMEKK